MASAELSEAEFIAFLTAACGLMAQFSSNGSLHYLCMDWRHQYELLVAARAVVYDRSSICAFGLSPSPGWAVRTGSNTS